MASGTIKATGTLSGIISSSYATITYKKTGNVVMINIKNPKNLPSQATTTIASLPASIIPSTSVTTLVKAPSESIEVRYTVSSNGTIDVYNYSTVSSGNFNTECTIVYIV